MRDINILGLTVLLLMCENNTYRSYRKVVRVRLNSTMLSKPRYKFDTLLYFDSNICIISPTYNIYWLRNSLERQESNLYQFVK